MYFKTIPKVCFLLFLSFLSLDKSRLTLCSYILSRLAATTMAAVSEDSRRKWSSMDGGSTREKFARLKICASSQTLIHTRDTLSLGCSLSYACKCHFYVLKNSDWVIRIVRIRDLREARVIRRLLCLLFSHNITNKLNFDPRNSLLFELKFLLSLVS